eukprot:COSAG05_NODE_801_length_7224_cov_4.552000_5_plen_111_part_00
MKEEREDDDDDTTTIQRRYNDDRLRVCRLTGIVGRALHRVGLTGARLAVGKHADVVAVARRAHQLPGVLEDLALRGVVAEDLVELEALLLPVLVSRNGQTRARRTLGKRR